MKKTNYFREKENLVNLMSTAFYGSSWFYVAVSKELGRHYKGYETREDKWAAILLDGGYIWVCDIEDEEEPCMLTLEMIEKAWQSDDTEVIRAKLHILDNDDDYYDADVIIQTALFGKVVFG